MSCSLQEGAIRLKGDRPPARTPGGAGAARNVEGRRPRKWPGSGGVDVSLHVDWTTTHLSDSTALVIVQSANLIMSAIYIMQHTLCNILASS